MPTLFLVKAGLRVCPGVNFGPVSAKSVHSVSLTAWTHGRTPCVLGVFPFQKAVELRLKTALFCEGCCGITDYSYLEMGGYCVPEGLHSCPIAPLSLRDAVLGSVYWVNA